MAKKVSNKREPKFGLTKRKDPHKPKNKNKLRSYKKYVGQGR